jgi:uncharacterized protein (TIGR00661 family)
MRILYGVVGEGMGHATRSRVVIEHLLAAGHEVLVVVSGKAHAFMTRSFAAHPRVRVEEIHGLHLILDDGELDKSETLLSNLEKAPHGLKKNFEVYRERVTPFAAQVVVSDFESFAYTYARLHDIPVISVDNMQILNRAEIAHELIDDERSSFNLAKFAVKAKLPGAYHYLVSTFFFPRVRKARTTLVPPILRQAILEAKRERGEHILVYQTGQVGLTLLPVLKTLPGNYRVYGSGREGTEGNVTLRPFSETGFVDDMRTARAVIANAGFSLTSECVHLGVPMLALPVAEQFEQILNARALEREGYGRATTSLDADVLRAFLDDVPRCEEALVRYPRHDNTMLFGCLDELLMHIGRDEPPVTTLESANMGAFDPYPIGPDDDVT